MILSLVVMKECKISVIILKNRSVFTGMGHIATAGFFRNPAVAICPEFYYTYMIGFNFCNIE